ncbi:MAG: hypothetical protein ONB48_14510 [candidate division KSB1 bacterium]|nr:hypothetical protein [candidate division KSB1 bacterium]MDZ7273551.1 hypothetical protein [candidate division KSB1 bacterium]MDZ7286858.1 hypothetical protein [candidate division KSB1 bacterium]MDZ7355927.1 hypothetical protein [candidate division KSB1 bacterium]MDZ7383599.1 hypothetical protein [candidate division KSB1 bacterium]
MHLFRHLQPNFSRNAPHHVEIAGMRRNIVIKTIVNFHCQKIRSVEFYEAGHLEFKPQVSADVLSQMHAIEPDFCHLIRGFKLNEYFFPSASLIHRKLLAVPAYAAPIRGVNIQTVVEIAIINDVAGIPTVRQSYRLPIGIIQIRRLRIGDIAFVEFPIVIEIDPLPQGVPGFYIQRFPLRPQALKRNTQKFGVAGCKLIPQPFFNPEQGSINLHLDLLVCVSGDEDQYFFILPIAAEKSKVKGIGLHQLGHVLFRFAATEIAHDRFVAIEIAVMQKKTDGLVFVAHVFRRQPCPAGAEAGMDGEIFFVRHQAVEINGGDVLALKLAVDLDAGGEELRWRLGQREVLAVSPTERA